MKNKFLFIQLFAIGLFLTFTNGCKKDEVTVKSIAETSFFTTKYTKERVWDVQRTPAYPVAGQDWTLSEFDSALDATGAYIDWGSNRYVMFVAEADKNDAGVLIDDVYTIGTKYNVALKLYESNGTLVKVVSNWGSIIGKGTKGFIYEGEGEYGTFFSVSTAKANAEMIYRPTILIVTKVSELNK